MEEENINLSEAELNEDTKGILANGVDSLYPIQYQVLTLLEQQKTQHFALESPSKSGKTMTILLSAASELHKNQSKKFFVVLCCSKAKCLSTLQAANNFCSENVKAKAILDENLAELNLDPSAAYFLIATPMKFLSFIRNSKIEINEYAGIAVDDIDFCFSFGFKDEISAILDILKGNVLLFFTGIFLGDDVKEIKKKYLANCANIRLEGDESIVKDTSETITRIPQYFYVGNEIEKYIILFILNRLKFITGKTLILTHDIDESYKIKLFLDRCNVASTSVYNRKHPKAVKGYVLSNFNTGLSSILISTKEILKESKKIATRTRDKAFKGISNIVVFSCSLNANEIYQLYEHIRGQFGCIVGLFNKENEYETEVLSDVFEISKTIEGDNLRELPLKPHEVTAFNYRIKDLLASISRKQVKYIQLIDIQKIIMKSRGMAQYFASNPNEKELIKHSIITKSAYLNKSAVRMYEEVPEYLLPSAVKEKYKSDLENKRFIEIKSKASDSRRSKGNFKLDLQKEDPLETDAADLLPVSGRKLWKMRHGKTLKRRNLRLEKKGIFN